MKNQISRSAYLKKLGVFLGFFVLFSLAPLLSPKKVDTANLSSTKDTLETSRLSFYSSLEGDHTAGSTLITIDTTNHPSKNTANLHSGDTVYIGSSGDNPYTITDILNSAQFTINKGLNSLDKDDTDPIYVKRTAVHTVNFTTASAVANGSFRIKIPVSSTLGDRNDGIPDPDGFDANFITTGDLTAPGSGDGYTFSSPTIGIGGTSPCTSGYWCFNFPYTGTGGTGVSFSGTGDQFVIGSTNKMINPSPGGTHTVGTADNYSVIIENLDGSNNVVDSTAVSLGIIESVRVTATVDPSITFIVGGVGTGGTPCGLGSLSVGTSAYVVPFGSLTLNTFSNAAQTLTVTTNATSGYAVTIQEDDQLGKDGAVSPYIQDTSCAATPCSHTTPRDWTSASSYPGFGYSLQEVTADAAAFEYDDSGTFYAKQLPAIADPDVVQTVMSGSTVASSEQIYVCYRIAVGPSQQAGDYENLVTYIATGTF